MAVYTGNVLYSLSGFVLGPVYQYIIHLGTNLLINTYYIIF
jgi:hypothetical protein